VAAAWGHGLSNGTPLLPAATSRNASIEGRRRLVAESLRVGNPANNARDLTAQADPQFECQIVLDVDQIRPYECNPRRTENPRFADIKESIRSSGIRNPITVTRRPGAEYFIVESGGNTRLRALQQLSAETGDACFKRISVLFRPWRSESHVLIAHLIENEQRGDMTFWDKATGIAALKTQLESEQGHELSVRQLETDLKRVGIVVSHTTLNYYRFATERLRLLGEGITDLSGGDVTKIQPQLNLIKHYAQSRASFDESVLYERVLEPVFRRYAAAYSQTRDFKPEALCQDCEEALAQHLNEPVAQCRSGIAALARSATATVSGQQDADVNPLYSDPTVGVTPVIGKPKSGGADSSTDSSPTAAPQSSAGHSNKDDQQVRAEVERLARLAGIQDCLRPGKPPLGYSVCKLWPKGGSAVPRLSRQVWWLLCQLCGTHGDDSVTADNADAAGAGYGDELVIDVAFVFWLLDAADEAASSFRQIITLLRAGGITSVRGRLPSGYAAHSAGYD
jgi:ParB family protein of integrating conjugative element (PFGI_1 class)